MQFELPAAFALGFLGGFKHAFEPDHIIAVSTLLHDQPNPFRALRTGLAWGAGHTTTLVLGVLAIGLLRLQISPASLGYFEIPVAIMLLVLGGWALFGAGRHLLRLRRHMHDQIEHYHIGQPPHPHGFSIKRTGWQGYLVGLVHGLAGSGALMLLVAVTLPSTAAGILYALIFGLGSILGMGAVTMGLAFSLSAARSRPMFYNMLTGLSGALSVLLGASILYGLI